MSQLSDTEIFWVVFWTFWAWVAFVVLVIWAVKRMADRERRIEHDAAEKRKEQKSRKQ